MLIKVVDGLRNHDPEVLVGMIDLEKSIII